MQDGVSPFVSVLLTHPASGWHELVQALVSYWHFSCLPHRFFDGSLSEVFIC